MCVCVCVCEGASSPYFSFYHASQVVLDSVIKTLMTARQSRVLQQSHNKIYTAARQWTVLQGLDSEDLCCSHKDSCSSHIVQTCRQTLKTFYFFAVWHLYILDDQVWIFFYGIDNWNPSTFSLAEERPMGSRLLDMCVPTCYSVRFYGVAVRWAEVYRNDVMQFSELKLTGMMWKLLAKPCARSVDIHRDNESDDAGEIMKMTKETLLQGLCDDDLHCR